MAQWLVMLATSQRKNLSSVLSTHISSQLPTTPAPGIQHPRLVSALAHVAYIFVETHVHK